VASGPRADSLHFKRGNTLTVENVNPELTGDLGGLFQQEGLYGSNFKAIGLRVDMNNSRSQLRHSMIQHPEPGSLSFGKCARPRKLSAGPGVCGLLWIPRQDDEAKALVLFGDRITESAFGIEIDREPLYEGKHLDALLTLAEHLGITQVIGL
jgi:hypothetical protein